MYLAFDVPSGWTTRREGERQVIERSDGARLPRIEAGPLVRADSIDLRRVIATGLPGGARIQLTPLAERKTRDGWRMQWCALEAWVGDKRVAVRLGAVYEAVYYLSLAIVELAEPADRDAVLDVLATARPVFRSVEIVSITDLYREDDA